MEHIFMFTRINAGAFILLVSVSPLSAIAASQLPTDQLLAWTSDVSFSSETAAGAQSSGEKQTQTGYGKHALLSGTVIDPSGALITDAKIEVKTMAGSSVATANTDGKGRFTIKAPLGVYQVIVQATGFDPFYKEIHLTENAITLRAQLIIATAQATVEVDAAAGGLGLSADENKSALDLKGGDLATLSDDDVTFQQQLLALAGDDGSHPPQVFVDGFSGGKFPPKSSITEVKINENPFSAAYDSVGMGRIEIITKPGTGSLHGAFDLFGDPSSFNSRNPFLSGQQPDYYRVHTVGHVSGPLGKSTSFFMSGDYYDQQNNAVINATSVSGDGSIYSVSQAVPNPTRTGQYSGRLDHVWSSKNTMSARYEFDSVDQTNGGLGQSVLPGSAFNSTQTAQTFQIRDVQFIGVNMELDSRFEWIRTRIHQDPLSSAPAIVVQGTVNGGGNPLQVYHDNEDQLEFREDAIRQFGKHMLRFGARYRLYRDAILSTAGFNGTYTFSNIAKYQASVLGTPSASQFQITMGQPDFVALTGDIAAWADDEWKLRNNVTLNFGVRFESQSAIPDHSDPSPHFGFSWAPFKTNRHLPGVVLRGGSGIYYDRFSIANLMTSVRQGNPILQRTYTVADPGFFGSVPTPTQNWTLTTYTIAPSLRSEYEIDSSISAEFSLGKRSTISLTYLNKLQRHQWVSINANAPRSDGTRPYGDSAGNMYQFVSEAQGMGNWFYIDPRFRLWKGISVTGHFNFKRQRSSTFGPTFFASNRYNIRQDYGRSPSDRHQSANVAINADLKWGLRTGVFLNARSGEPFNITTGSDTNGDTIYNDRPSYATAASDPAYVVRTVYGNLNLRPKAGEQIIPINLGKSAGPFVSLQLQASKTWHLGEPIGKARAKGGTTAGRYALVLSAEAQNLTNTVSPAPPVGVLTSPYFGRPITTSNNFLSTSAANRTFTLHMAFSF